jgi:hypothetical protein
MTAPLPPKPVNRPSEPPMTRMSNELNKSGTVQQMASTMNGKLERTERSASSLASLPSTPDQL